MVYTRETNKSDCFFFNECTSDSKFGCKNYARADLILRDQRDTERCPGLRRRRSLRDEFSVPFGFSRERCSNVGGDLVLNAPVGFRFN